MALRTTLLALSMLAWSTPSQTKDDDALLVLARLKTAYLFNIAKFVSWPGDLDTVTLCISGDGNVASLSRALEGRDIGGGRTLVVRTGAEAGDGCAIYYEDQDYHTLGAEGGFPSYSLTISDADGALGKGFAIQLFMEREKLRFAVNADVVRGAGYQISANLLRLARTPG
ncbi:MAG: YfiR family protein [Pseudomonadales bacterium]|nr:YfiR family protein [Pseudomonadales bacterium]MCP5182626.1 YfiR family protein [Pseudomonadales bacterium]